MKNNLIRIHEGEFTLIKVSRKDPYTISCNDLFSVELNREPKNLGEMRKVQEELKNIMAPYNKYLM